jgi:hypothetical protein
MTVVIPPTVFHEQSYDNLPQQKLCMSEIIADNTDSKFITPSDCESKSGSSTTREIISSLLLGKCPAQTISGLLNPQS